MGTKYRCILLILMSALIFACGEHDPKSTKAGLVTAKEMLEKQEFDKARVLINKVLSDDPNLTEAYTVLGQIAFSQYDLKAAFDAYSKAVSLDPNQFEGQLGLAKLLMVGGSFDEAMARVDTALKLQPGNPRALELKGSILLATQDLKGAAELFEGLLKNNIVISDIQYSIVAKHYLQDDAEKAEAVLKLGLAHYPKGVLLRESLSELYVKSGNYRSAEEQLRALLESDPRRVKYTLDLADILLTTSRKPEADNLLGKLLENTPGEAEFQAVADFYISKNMELESESVLELGVRKNPNTIRLRLLLAEVLLNAGQTDRPAQLAEDCIRMSRQPDSLETLQAKSLLARARMLRGQPGK